ncbi:OsmC family protein [Flammeovirgaceae bacterium SG7u.111]|nr:OsmC family protein [Flammeovirgaceae bacterium SG7u.132]WPO36014.1 OsmC family protein [Flammeovirgaceae bacterium SG7u.111]
MKTQHQYNLKLTWTGNQGDGTSNYKTYDRSHTIAAENKSAILCSSDPAFRGDKTKHNPEELLLGSISGCHMLWYLHLCATSGVVVVEYDDDPIGMMVEEANGSGHFTEVVLKPHVVVAEASMIAKANELHHQANKLCFIANSCNFPINHEPVCVTKN